MICRTTTPDLIKVVTRLEEFFSQQFQSSKQMLSSWQYVTPASRRNLVTAATAAVSRATSDSDSQSDFGKTEISDNHRYIERRLQSLAILFVHQGEHFSPMLGAVSFF